MTTCPGCGTANEQARMFCKSCAAPLQAEAEPREPVKKVGVHEDIQTVELAWVPAEMRAPTTWTIALGVFWGLVLFSVASAVVSVVVFVVLLSLGQS